jgi:LemA protein
MEMLLPLLVLIGLAGGPLVWLVVSYNRFVGIAQHQRESWSDIEVEMKRRYDLIPRLVETARGYAKHEREVLEQVVALRSRAMANHGTAAEQAVDETTLALGMKQLFALAESYPDLKADVHFLALQEELANTEDRIAAARRFYNGNVRELNQLCEQFPTNLVAGLFGFARGSYFELASDAERVVPRVG